MYAPPPALGGETLSICRWLTLGLPISAGGLGSPGRGCRTRGEHPQTLPSLWPLQQSNLPSWAVVELPTGHGWDPGGGGQKLKEMGDKPTGHLPGDEEVGRRQLKASVHSHAWWLKAEPVRRGGAARAGRKQRRQGCLRTGPALTPPTP